MPITPPKTPTTDPDHALDAEFAIEPAFQRLATEAEAAGWNADVVIKALIGLAEARRQMLRAHAETEAAVVAEVLKRRQ